MFLLVREGILGGPQLTTSRRALALTVTTQSAVTENIYNCVGCSTPLPLAQRLQVVDAIEVLESDHKFVSVCSMFA